MAPGNPTRGVLETWWANPGPNPSNGLCLQPHDGLGDAGQMPRLSRAGPPATLPGLSGSGMGCGGPGSEGCLGPLSGHLLGCLRSPCLSLPWGCQDQRRLAGTGGRVPVGSVAPCWGRAGTPWPLGRAQGPWPSPVTAALRKDSSGGPTAQVRVCGCAQHRREGMEGVSPTCPPGQVCPLTRTLHHGQEASPSVPE